jgi:RIO-like serine/threonine protein kinase
MFHHKTIVFADEVPAQERSFIQGSLDDALRDDREILKGHHSAKKFYLMPSTNRQIFVKSRHFEPLLRRIGRTVRKTKEEAEFRNYLLLRERGIPCPAPIASARLCGSLFVHTSLLLTEYLPGALTLREFLLGGTVPRETVFEGLFAFLYDLKDKGFIHEDLQWNNILVDENRGAFQFLVIDALHIRFVRETRDEEFLKTLTWFSEFMKRENAPQDVYDQFLKKASSW